LLFFRTFIFAAVKLDFLRLFPKHYQQLVADYAVIE